ncbi:unnamed protein product [Adineta ricciae]|uniref:MalT-like TPR region domain-containing protein n=1 Tax=Adineta ricciae TaxID=249248 RepID=A0A815ICC1_ADIRI|nr:unnamed protein product [Adineta ricciae]CAF1366451.1 unnamed protein product [Adineta ricciae]
MAHLDQAEHLYREQLRHSNSNDQFFTLVHLGQITHAKYENKRALNWYEQAMKHVENQIETSTIGTFYNFIGEVHLEKEDSQFASSIFQQALELGNDHLDKQLELMKI